MFENVTALCKSGPSKGQYIEEARDQVRSAEKSSGGKGSLFAATMNSNDHTCEYSNNEYKLAREALEAANDEVKRAKTSRAIVVGNNNVLFEQSRVPLLLIARKIDGARFGQIPMQTSAKKVPERQKCVFPVLFWRR